MLTIGRSLLVNPDLLLLDEPSEGLSPLVVEGLLEQVGALKREGLTILLAEQGVGFSLALADRESSSKLTGSATGAKPAGRPAPASATWARPLPSRSSSSMASPRTLQPTSVTILPGPVER